MSQSPEPIMSSQHLAARTKGPLSDARVRDLKNSSGFRANHSEVVSMATELQELRHRIASLEK